MKKIVIINCGGNILSLVRAINKFNFQVNVTNNAKEIEEASHIFLPGVGAFKNAMRKLEEFNLINFLRSLDYKRKNAQGKGSHYGHLSWHANLNGTRRGRRLP